MSDYDDYQAAREGLGDALEAIEEQPPASGIAELDSLVRTWRTYITRHAGEAGQSLYLRGLEVCADQLDETIARLRANAEV